MPRAHEDCKESGKQKKANAIINACVPRKAAYSSKVVAKERTLEQFVSTTTVDQNKNKDYGLKKSIFIGV